MRFQTINLAFATVFAGSANSFHRFSLDPAAEIRNVLAHYCIIFNTKTYSDLFSVYTSDAIANFTTIGLGVLHGLPAIEKAMNSSLFGIPTQHAVTTSYISEIKKNEASAIT